ncbi:hypothetical protein EI42_01600 [Thermosporothrix hazakensis]|jgi:hypothetical protein|uniref:Uncharacterized protein n=2 Tax=Thermosporothrix TaxID=768650 RepID=A0A326UAJ6_THEHA|nr:hypothetical protein [Thermosporothrix hazakensis]PZW33050.1 hypothetical protein EI42_01600 [Thermosporothrix hazakensis]BBH91030.1 hypothetical protein KTC_57810 [Thermosporothrix sp. COM3]GCE49082.1 hypothetical protein KTH_39510 [Thermosporothrix hazakensis]
MSSKVEMPFRTEDAQEQYFQVTDAVPAQVWYWAAVSSIVASAMMFLMNKKDWAIFVGQWPPAFLLFAIFHKILRPSSR